MRFLKKNSGFTLVELIVTIAVGSIVTLAATTVLLLGIRIYAHSNEMTQRQNEIRAGLTVIETLVSEAAVTQANEQGVSTAEGAVLTYDDTYDIIKTGAGAQVLANVSNFSVTPTDDLLKFTIEIGEETYSLSVYCRLAAIVDTTAVTEGNALSVASLEEETTAEAILTAAVSDETLTPNVRAFLETLASQLGSTGRILTEDGEGEYYSQWYIGSYADNPGWSSDTPWCACFVSWALEECCGYLSGETPRYANVDTFWVDLVTTDSWKLENPEPGDLIFFDWIADTEYNPQHVGVVIGTDSGLVYTIEGNVDGAVALRSYPLDDAHILGYGLLNWTK